MAAMKIYQVIREYFKVTDEGSLFETTMILDWKRRLVFWSGAISVALVAIALAIAAEWANGIFHKILTISPWQ